MNILKIEEFRVYKICEPLSHKNRTSGQHSVIKSMELSILIGQYFFPLLITNFFFYFFIYVVDIKNVCLFRPFKTI